MSFRTVKVNVYSYNCHDCGKYVETSNPGKCAKCSCYLCGKCSKIDLCSTCKATLSPSTIKNLYSSRRLISIITWTMVIIGVLLIFIDTTPFLSNVSSAILGFLLAVFSIPYYFLSTLIFYPKKVANVQSSSTKPRIIKTKYGKVNMDNLPLLTYYRCRKCGVENSAIGVFRTEDNKQAVKCECGEIATEDNAVYKCTKCGKYYPGGVYRCPKCKY